MATPKNDILIKEPERRIYTYKKADMTLQFTLERSKTKLKIYLEMLQAGISDIEKEIERIDKERAG